MLQRACVYSGMQDWDKAIDDFDYILSYQVSIPLFVAFMISNVEQPQLDQVIALRARAHCCRREWSKAIADYNDILSRNPDSSSGLLGLSEVCPPYEDLPMLDKSVVDS